MACKVTMSLLAERQDGPIGDDWKYSVEAKVFNQGLQGKGVIKVPKHTLGSGHTQAPPGPPAPVSMPAGPCGETVLVRIVVNAAEVDWLISDKGSGSMDVNIKCPGPGESRILKEVEISVGVRESPGITGETSIFKSTIRLVAECE